MPLSGITVLEVGVFMAGPYATMQLADLGAEVLKIENPAGGDPVRQAGPFVDGTSSPFARLNRNKKSVALDLKSPDGRAAFRRLADHADVLVENLRPGALRALRLDYETLRQSNPRLIYASASGWGQDGPLAGLPGLDIMAQARSGLMSITGSPGGPPAKVGVPVCDLVCGLYVAMAVIAALRERDRSGEGQYIDVSLLESGVSLAVWEAGKYFATGEVGGPLGTAHQSQAPYQAVRCADGWLTLGAITPKTWLGLTEVLGLQAIANDGRFEDAYRRKENVAELIPIIEQATQTWTVADLVAALDRAEVPCAPISDYGEVFTAEALTERDFFWDAPGGVRQLGSPMRLSRTPTRRDAAGPALGADTRAALLAVGYTNDEIDSLVGGQS
ncbi:CaiB/BaiF CoA-transferase family protein [Kibdelosporangium persicum]|uniref:L-carnitine dehydratase/bile acid-inducible protein F n=1 Tax=Kibdelosporangium persicum TaxID=2698649 RepID=A0ABX2EWF9_9PSEU|nr:CoA transferase [Kibdelosporangium persicum]NRN63383.1 L-carnitine dehydratase/bile acid-inducible protein F [Kibdelosporangium persicum]